jgi:hypothetical protein
MMKIEAALTEHGVSSEDIDKAKSYQGRAGGSLEKILLNMGSFSEELLPSVYSHLLDAPILSEEQLVPQPQHPARPLLPSWQMHSAPSCQSPPLESTLP